MRGIPGSEDGAVEAIRAQALVEVRGPHGLHHVRLREHALGRLRGGLKAGPHVSVCVRVSQALVTSIDFLEVVRDRLVDLVPLADELVLLDHRLHYRFA